MQKFTFQVTENNQKTIISTEVQPNAMAVRKMQNAPEGNVSLLLHPNDHFNNQKQ